MPAISQADFNTLRTIIERAHEAFVTANLRPEADCERFAGVTFDLAMKATAERPEPMANLADAYLTALMGSRFLPDIRGLGGLQPIHAALGMKPDPGRIYSPSMRLRKR
jgi:hypothetical protein